VGRSTVSLDDVRSQPTKHGTRVRRLHPRQPHASDESEANEEDADHPADPPNDAQSTRGDVREAPGARNGCTCHPPRGVLQRTCTRLERRKKKRNARDVDVARGRTSNEPAKSVEIGPRDSEADANDGVFFCGDNRTCDTTLSLTTHALTSAIEQNLDGKIEEAIKEAEEACEGGVSGECAAAWDSVEELSAEASHKRSRAKADPLEEFCESNPDSDECRVYDD